MQLVVNEQIVATNQNVTRYDIGRHYTKTKKKFKGQRGALTKWIVNLGWDDHDAKQARVFANYAKVVDAVPCVIRLRICFNDMLAFVGSAVKAKQFQSAWSSYQADHGLAWAN